MRFVLIGVFTLQDILFSQKVFDILREVETKEDTKAVDDLYRVTEKKAA